eukprot:scaffold3208_cov402-Prasinococcus_capsulatus_cf.AAC.7
MRIFAKEAEEQERGTKMRHGARETEHDTVDPAVSDMLASDGSDYDPDDLEDVAAGSDDYTTSSQDTSHDDESGSLAASDEEATLMRTVRRRKRVDYRKLNDELFGCEEAYENPIANCSIVRNGIRRLPKTAPCPWTDPGGPYAKRPSCRSAGTSCIRCLSECLMGMIPWAPAHGWRLGYLHKLSRPPWVGLRQRVGSHGPQKGVKWPFLGPGPARVAADFGPCRTLGPGPTPARAAQEGRQQWARGIPKWEWPRNRHTVSDSSSTAGGRAPTGHANVSPSDSATLVLRSAREAWWASFRSLQEERPTSLASSIKSFGKAKGRRAVTSPLALTHAQYIEAESQQLPSTAADGVNGPCLSFVAMAGFPAG